MNRLIVHLYLQQIIGESLFSKWVGVEEITYLSVNILSKLRKCILMVKASP